MFPTPLGFPCLSEMTNYNDQSTILSNDNKQPTTKRKITKDEIIERLCDLLSELKCDTIQCIDCDWIDSEYEEWFTCNECVEYICSDCATSFKHNNPDKKLCCDECIKDYATSFN